MRQFWQGLQRREQRALMVAVAAVLLFIIYSMVITPYLSAMQRLELSVATQQKDLAWMKNAAAEVKALRNNTASGVKTTNQSLLSLVDSTARESGLTKAIKQLTPSGEHVSVRLQEAEFDAILLWLDKLDTRNAVMVNSLTMERLSETGVVNATVVLGR